jgi:hypothetical protein
VRDVDDGDTLGLEPNQEVEQVADLDPDSAVLGSSRISTRAFCEVA